MDLIRNFGIRTKYLIPVVLTTVGLLLVIVYGVKTLNSNSNTFVSFIEKDQTLLLSLNGMYAQGLQSEQATRNVLLNPKDGKAKANYIQANEDFNTQMARARQSAIGHQDVLTQLDNIAQQWQSLDALKEQVQQLAISGNSSKGVDLLTTAETSSWRNIKANLLALIAAAEKNSLTKKADVQKATHDASVNVITYSVVVVLVSLLIILLAVNAFVKPIRVLEQSADKVASGDTNVHVEVKSNDEIGRLSKSFNIMVESIRNSLGEVKEKNAVAELALKEAEKAKTSADNQRDYLSVNVGKILAEMERFSDGNLNVQMDTDDREEIGKLFNGFNRAVDNIRSMVLSVNEAVQATASAANQISSSTEEMSAGSQEQSAQSTEVASAVEEMAKTIIETTRNASSAAQAAKTAGSTATESGNIINDTIAGMDRIAQVVKTSSEKIKALGRSSDQIGEIIQVIDDIADQTNLLALNAAIEAARAGEQGRGFAVVADEVRKLAERTTKATKEIADMIKRIQVETGDVVKSIEEGNVEVEKGKESVDKARQALQEIISGANEVVDIVSQVAAASEEQSSAAEQISKNIEAISKVSQESAVGTQQISKAADDLSKLTLNLQNLISQFKIEGSEDFSSNDLKTSDLKSDYAVRSNGRLIKS